MAVEAQASKLASDKEENFRGMLKKEYELFEIKQM